MSAPVFEVRGQWALCKLPRTPRPWMSLGRTYTIVLRRSGPLTFPEAEIRDLHTDQVLDRYSWPTARDLFDTDRRP